jgi:hypothetical protein
MTFHFANVAPLIIAFIVVLRLNLYMRSKRVSKI